MTARLISVVIPTRDRNATLALCLDRLAWTPDGPRCVGPTYTPQPLPV